MPEPGENIYSISALKSFAAGGVGGMCTVLTGHPLDTIKVRLQTMPHVQPGQKPLYLGTYDCARKTFMCDGFLGFYKGMAAPLVGVSPMFSVFFLGYNLGRDIFSKDINKITKPEIFYSGLFAGVFTTVIVVPGERIKCLLQIQSSTTGYHKYNGPVDVVRKLYKEGGIRSIYKGTSATLLRDVPASGIYFLSYEWIKELLTPRTASKESLGVPQTLFAGGMAGVFNWLIAIPADVLKSRLQTASEGRYPRGIRSVFSEMMAKEGLFALYRGITPVMIRAFPANAACFLGYEVTLKLLNYIFPNH